MQITTIPTAQLAELKTQFALAQTRATAIVTTLEREGRQEAPTPEEQTDLEEALARGKLLKAEIARVEQTLFHSRVQDIFGGREFPPGTVLHGARRSWGAQFVASDAWTWLKSTRHTRSGNWMSPSVELRAETLTETGSPIVPPQYLPGIVPSPTAPIVLSDLFAPGVATSGSIAYNKETLFTNAAAAVAEGGGKPESTLRFAPVTQPLTKVAHFLPVSDEMLEDDAAMSSYIDARLRLGVQLEEEDQLLNGSGTPPDMRGLLNQTGLAAAIPATGNGLDSIAAQIGAIETAEMLRVDAVVLNPSDWLTLGLLKTLNGEYLAGSPFLQGGPSSLFGRRVATTPLLAQGTALVGCFATGGAQLFKRGPIRVAVSNSHADFFIKNLTAIRAEQRIALALYRVGAFGLVTGLNPTTP